MNGMQNIMEEGILMVRATLLAMTLATPAMAEVMTVQTTKHVEAAMDALEAAVREAGAKV